MPNHTVATKFFFYSQNNPGGRFRIDKSRGINFYVVIEAIDASDANTRAEGIGLYFNGVDEGMDCSCCGDRWDPVDIFSSSLQGSDIPMVYDHVVEDGDQVSVHYFDGSFKNFDGNHQPTERSPHRKKHFG